MTHDRRHRINATTSLPYQAARPPVPALEVHDLTVSYHRKPVLWNVDLAVPPGKLVGIIGPNGAGKSTLIKAIMGLLPLSSGWVQVFGQPVEQPARQGRLRAAARERRLDFPVTAMDVVLMGRYGVGAVVPARSAARKSELARECAREGRHAPVRRPADQQPLRRAAAARLPRPGAGAGQQIYLMDEPFAGVDAATERRS